MDVQLLGVLLDDLRMQTARNSLYAVCNKVAITGLNTLKLPSLSASVGAILPEGWDFSPHEADCVSTL